MGRECVSCERTFDSTRGMKIHHKKAHGESIAGIEKDCAQCGDAFTVMASTEDRRRFCSRECNSEWRSVHYTGDDNPNWRGGPVDVVCKYCEDTFSVKPNQADARTFCSYECKGQWRAENVTGADHWNWSGGLVEVECTYCGQKLTRKQNKAERHQPFCDHECYGAWRSEHLTGEDNPQWAGGGCENYRGEWRKRREERVRFDGYECADCGIGREEHQERYGRDLNVHHITPYKEFEDPRDAHGLLNLVTVCCVCHRKRETADS